MENSILLGLASAAYVSLLLWGISLWFRWWNSQQSGMTDGNPSCFTRQDRVLPDVPYPCVLLAIFWVGLHLVGAILGQPSSTLPSVQDLSNAAILQPVFIATLLLALWALSPVGSRPDDLISVQDLKGDLQAGLELYAFSLVPTTLLLFVSLLWKTSENQHVLLTMIQQTPSPLLFVVIGTGAVVVAPFVEELIFRVVLQFGRLQPEEPRETLREPTWERIWCVAIFFCLGHGIADALQLMPLALCLGFSMAHRKSYLSLVTAHACFNGLMLLFSIATLETSNVPTP